MRRSKPLLLYSTNSFLAYRISEQFYRGHHFVWCAPFFGSGGDASLGFDQPPSSSPRAIYHAMLSDIRDLDRHSERITRNKSGLLSGAVAQCEAGVITEDQKQRIYAMVDAAELAHFKPLLYVIPYRNVEKILEEVEVRDLASAVSLEYRIPQLPRRHFDVLDLTHQP